MRAEEFLQLLHGVRRSGAGWVARCPAHDDKDPSLSIAEAEDGRILLKCFAGCSAEAVVAAVRLELKDLYPASGRPAAGAKADREPSVNPATPQHHGLTLSQLCEAKRLPEQFLLSLGVSNSHYNGLPAVRIPYLGPEGEVLAVRFRTAMEGQRFVWRSGDKVALYGLARLAVIRAAGWVLLVEGESDCWTAWHHDLPALGIPGKSTWKETWRDYLAGLRVYLWQEPGAEDLSRAVFTDVPELLIIPAPTGIKDISEAHLQGQNLQTLLEALKPQAIPAERIREEAEAERVAELGVAVAALLAHRDPLEKVAEAIKKLGYGGDLRYPLLTYLAATSRLLAMRTGTMPVHLLLVGSPSAGKSYTLQLVLILLPTCAYHVIDAGSPRVLIYDVTDLKHRVTVFSEADSLPAGEDNPAASAVRNLLQDHHLHYKVAIRDAKTGGIVVHEVKKPGPSVLITTAVKRLGAQLDSRLFSLEVPDDQERVRQALLTQAEIELNGTKTPDSDLVAYQDYLQALAPWEVVVPFARVLSVAIGKSLSAPRILRDFQRLLSLVKSVAVLRHCHRLRDASGRLIATLEDYRTVFDLVGDMYEASASGASKRVRDVVGMVATLRAEGVDTVTLNLLAQRLDLHKSSVSRHVNVALKNQWLCNTQDKKKQPMHLVLGEPLPEPAGLPTPDSVAVLQSKPAEAAPREEGEI